LSQTPAPTALQGFDVVSVYDGEWPAAPVPIARLSGAINTSTCAPPHAAGINRLRKYKDLQCIRDFSPPWPVACFLLYAIQ